MSEERMRVLKMVAEGKISVDEADELLSTLNGDRDNQQVSAMAGHVSSTDAGRKPTFMKVRVKSTTGDNVDVKVPLNLLRAGIRLTALIPKPAMDQINTQMKERGFDFDLTNIKPGDIEELIEALAALEVNVDSKNGDTVRVFCE
jgi:hypothetical protein